MAGNAPSTVRTASPIARSVRRLWVVLCCFLAVMVATVSQGTAAVWAHGGHSTYEQVLVHEREIARGNARHHPAPAADSPVDHHAVADGEHHAEKTAQQASERHDPCAHDASGPVQTPDGPQVAPGSSVSVAFAGAVQAAFVSTATLDAGVGSREPRVGFVLPRRQGFPPPPFRPPISPSV